MMFYKRIKDGYITEIGTNGSGIEISGTEYNSLLSLISELNSSHTSMGYKLKEDLTVEEFELPPMPEEEPTAEELLSIITEGSV